MDWRECTLRWSEHCVRRVAGPGMLNKFPSKTKYEYSRFLVININGGGGVILEKKVGREVQ